MDKILISYIPHGVDSKVFHVIEKDTDEYKQLLETKKLIFDKIEPEFVLFYNSRNIKRKMTPDVILSYKEFCDKLPKDISEKCALILHTQPIDDNGTDLLAVVEAMCPNYKVYFSAGKVDPVQLNILYNIADATINLASNEGWGLSTTESLMSGTPIIATVTGGLQDQMRFVDENKNWINFSKEWGSNHDGRYKECGEWAFPVFPKTRSLVGSPLTPYIFDDRVDWIDASDVIFNVYSLGRDERKRRGLIGRNWLLTDEANMSSTAMCNTFINKMNIVFNEFEPRKKFTLYEV